MGNFDWTGTLNRISALREELEIDEEAASSGGGSSGGESSKGGESKGGESKEESLSATQIAALAEMLDCDIEALLQADDKTMAEAMEYLGYKLANAKYGRPGLSGKYPWDRNEGSVGYATQHAEPSHTGEPSDKSAKIPKDSSSPIAMKPKKQPC